MLEEQYIEEKKQLKELEEKLGVNIKKYCNYLETCVVYMYISNFDRY